MGKSLCGKEFIALQPQIELLKSKLETGDIVTPLEVKALLKTLESIKLSGNLISDDKIQSVAFAAAHNVCDFGAVNSLQHNAANIAEAIREALK